MKKLIVTACFLFALTGLSFAQTTPQKTKTKANITKTKTDAGVTKTKTEPGQNKN